MGESALNEWWYAIKTYQAPSEEQLSAIAGEPLQLLDDSDNEWWYALSPRTELAGYIPALFIESTEARRARLNTAKNKQLTLTQKEDFDKPKNKSKKKKVVFDALVYFDDGTQLSAVNRNSATFKRRSLAALLGRTKGDNSVQPEPPRDLRAEHHVLRVYADIWNLEATYKSVNATNETTADDVLAKALERFQAVDDGVTNYALYITYETTARRIAPHEYPFVELQNVPEKNKPLAKIMLKKLQPEKDALPLRIYGDEAMFKTIMVDRQTTVDEAVSLVVKKFKLGVEPDKFVLRDVRGAQETLLEPTSLLYETILKPTDPASSTQKFFLARKQVQPSESSEGRLLVRIYSHGLDLDIAYRAVLIDGTTTTKEVVRLALERYNSFEPANSYRLTLVVTNQDERTLNDEEFPLLAVQESEKAHPTAVSKLYLRKREDNSPLAAGPMSSERILMTKMPMRVYADSLTDGATDYKTVLVSDTTNTAFVLKQAMEKFKIAANDACYLAMSCEEQGMRPLDDEEIPLLVRNEMTSDNLTNIRCLIRKGTSSAGKSKFPLRVFGHLVWPDEGYKTVMLDSTATAKDVVRLAVGKFKKSENEDVVLCLMNFNGDGSGDLVIPNEISISSKLRSRDFTLRRSDDIAGLPCLAPDGTTDNGRRLSFMVGPPSPTLQRAAQPDSSSSKESESIKRPVNPSPLATVVSAPEAEAEAEGDEEDEEEDEVVNPLLANQKKPTDMIQRAHFNAMSITVETNDVSGSISPSTIRERPMSVLLENPNFLKELNATLSRNRDSTSED